MSAPGTIDLTMKIFGLNHMADKVLFDAFVKQQQALLKGLRAIDRAKHGSVRFDYVVEKLEIGSAVLGIHEKLISDKRTTYSPATELIRCGRQIARSEKVDEAIAKVVLKTYVELCRSTGKRFDYATLSDNEGDNVIRLDQYLRRKVHHEITSRHSEGLTSVSHFIGSAWGAFDGRLQEIDSRDRDLPEGHFRLSAGNIDIPCVLCIEADEIRAAFDQRVIAEGEAFYDGRSSLPDRIEIRSIRSIHGSGLLKWLGTFKGSEEPIWGADES
jgi:hypothetical protein